MVAGNCMYYMLFPGAKPTACSTVLPCFISQDMRVTRSTSQRRGAQTTDHGTTAASAGTSAIPYCCNADMWTLYFVKCNSENGGICCDPVFAAPARLLLSQSDRVRGIGYGWSSSCCCAGFQILVHQSWKCVLRMPMPYPSRGSEARLKAPIL